MIIFMGLLVMMSCTEQKVTTGYMVGEVMIICMVVPVMMCLFLTHLVAEILLLWISIKTKERWTNYFFQEKLCPAQMNSYHV
ncbi:Uncharacterised protein [Escherichia coli]|nr:Uncharacterised protein [Escherichia coli]